MTIPTFDSFQSLYEHFSHGGTSGEIDKEAGRAVVANVYVQGRLCTVDGDTLREAIAAAAMLGVWIAPAGSEHGADDADAVRLAGHTKADGLFVYVK